MPKRSKTKSLAKTFMAEPGKKFNLKKTSTSSHPGLGSKEEGEAALIGVAQELVERQKVFYADGNRSLLVVLQGMDTSGKDGTIRHAFGPMNPQGVRVTSFKAPTAEELAHDFLWRIHANIPKKGMIGIFNRSHYEDVLITRVHDIIPKAVAEKRYDQINAFEKHLTENGVTILKFCLHISKEEQKDRLQARLDRPDKRWKFNTGDLAERKLWDSYQDVYGKAIEKCSTPWAPWYVIPSDRKWYRNYAVAKITLDCLNGMNLSFPEPEDNLDSIVIED